MPILHATCEYKKTGPCSIRADVFPAKQPHSPVILFLHGGALIFGSRRFAPDNQIRLFNREGYSVVAADYRLAPETKLPDILGDIRDAVKWVGGEGAELFGFDASRLAVMGSSAGGYLSLMAGTFETKPRAILSFYGYGDIIGDWYSKPSEHYCKLTTVSEEDAIKSVGGQEKATGGMGRFAYYLHTRQQGTWAKSVSGLDPVTGREMLLPYCPIFSAGSDYPPTMLLHGDEDTDVPYEQSLRMHERLRELGVESELVTMPGMGHGFDGDGGKPEVKAALRRVVAFLHKHV